MELLAAWLLYPLALVCICLGLALALERLIGWRAPGALLLPIGFAALLALARLITASEATARLALPVIGALALLGLALGAGRLRTLRPDPWLLAVAAALYALLAAPIVLSGEPSFAGYLALPDTSHQLALADLYAHRGPDWGGLPESSARVSLSRYVASSYPVAAQATLGVTAPLGLLDLAWLYQPLLAFGVLMLSLSIWALCAPLLARRWQAAAVTFAASQPALLVGNYLTGSIKEITGVAVLAALVALVTAAISGRGSARALVPAAVAGVAALGALGPAALAYVAVPALVVAAVWGRRALRAPGLLRAPRLVTLGAIAAGGALLAVVALPMLRSLRTAITVSQAVLVDQKEELGHLAGPLDIAQALGIWLSGDFRYPTQSAGTPQTILLAIAGACAILGLVWAVRRRGRGPLLLAAAFLPVSLLLLQRGTAYADAKVLMLASPVVLTLAMLGAVVLWAGRWRAVSAVATAALTLGVLWSSALAYHDVSLAPYDRYAELLDINERLAGRGPAFFGEYDEFGKYLLRSVPGYTSPESPHPFRFAPYEPNALRDPKRRPSEKTPVDVDDVQLDYLESVPYIVLRRGPMTSRPPANFRLQSRGRHYDVWRRTPHPRVLAHKPMGPDVLHQAAPVSRRVARAWASRARRLGGRIAFPRRERPTKFLASHVPRPERWTGFGNFPEALLSDGPSNIESGIEFEETGRYHVWVEGSFARRMTIGLDGERLPHVPTGLNNPGAYVSLGVVRVTRGHHRLYIRQRGGDLRPGTGGYRSSLRHIGPIFFNPIANERPEVEELDPSRWRDLVGERVDWLEVVRR